MATSSAVAGCSSGSPSTAGFSSRSVFKVQLLLSILCNSSRRCWNVRRFWLICAQKRDSIAETCRAWPFEVRCAHAENTCRESRRSVASTSCDEAFASCAA